MMPLGRPGPSESGCGPVCGAAAGAHVSSPGAGRTAPCGGAFRGADSVYHSEPAGRASYDPPASDSDAPSCPPGARTERADSEAAGPAQRCQRNARPDGPVQD